MNFDFANQTIIVTGGVRGIGRAIAAAFLAAGARVIATYKANHVAAQKFAAEMGSERLIIDRFDVAQSGEVEQFYRRVEEQYGAFEVLVNNSGIRRDAVVGMMKEADWREVIDTNLTGAFLMSKYAVQSFMRRRYGRIITITSPIGRFGFAGQANYAASKAAQVAFTRSLSKETASRGITVNCVSPGFIDTDFIADLPEKQRAQYLEQIPLKRFGAGEDVAHAVLFLATREAAYITGAVLDVTGGL